MWEEKLFEQLKKQTSEYPVIALLDEIRRLDEKQKERIEILKQQLDGQPWSPSEWKQ